MKHQKKEKQEMLLFHVVYKHSHYFGVVNKAEVDVFI